MQISLTSSTIRLHAAHPVRVLSTRHTRTSAGPVAAFSLADLPPLSLRGVERGVDRGVDLGVELFERPRPVAPADRLACINRSSNGLNTLLCRLVLCEPF